MQILKISESSYAMIRKKELLKGLDSLEAKTRYAQYYDAVMKTADKLLRSTTFAYQDDASSKEKAFIQFQIKAWNECSPHLRNAALFEIKNYLIMEQKSIINDADKVLLENLTCKIAELKHLHEMAPGIGEDYAKGQIKVSWSEYTTFTKEKDSNKNYVASIEFVTRDYLKSENLKRK